MRVNEREMLAIINNGRISLRRIRIKVRRTAVTDLSYSVTRQRKPSCGLTHCLPARGVPRALSSLDKRHESSP